MIEKIKELRGSKTQKQYAEFLNIDIRTIQNWETRGTSKTTLALLQKIYSLENETKELKDKLQDDNITFQL